MIRASISAVVVIATLPLAAQITIDPIATTTWCAGMSVVLPFTAGGAFNPGNIFTAELSDASGSFTSPTVIGTVAGTGSGSVVCALPAGVSGTAFRVRVNSDSPAQTGTPCIEILALEAPQAGLDGFAAICGNMINATPFLGGTPDPGGVWSYYSGTGVWVSGDLFSADNGDVLQYTVTTPGGCTDAALVTVSVVQPPNAGSGSTTTVCADAAPFSLFGTLGGNPESGGFWTNPGGAPQSNTFTPGVSLPGCYTYAVLGVPPCPNAASAVCVQVSLLPDAGTGGPLAWCQSFGDVDLFAQLNGTPQPGGTWSDDDATGVLNAGVFQAGSIPVGTYAFTYSVSTPGCTPASATVSVSVGACLLPPALETE